MKAVHPHKKAWVISVNMGYGHERAAFGLEDLAYGDIITANAYPSIPSHEKKSWIRLRKLYESISRLRSIPFIGQTLFGFMDSFQKIPPFYPRRDLISPNIQLLEIYHLIEKKGLGKHLIQRLSKRNIPLITTFFTTAFAAEVHGYPGDIYCVICDADISRSWAPLDPKKSRIHYFAPNGRVVERLKLYGVQEDRIFLTGFPLPKQNIGGPSGEIVKQDLADRLNHLDPNRIFTGKYASTLERELGFGWHTIKTSRPLTLTFSVGGAGAQQDLAAMILTSLRKELLAKNIRINLEAGTRLPVADYFYRQVRKSGLGKLLKTAVNIHVYTSRKNYFRSFSKTLRTTDILWTKPSELSFYTGLGLPIVMAPPIGSQEEFNQTWLQTVNGGIAQNNPAFANEWIFDWLSSGGLARFAWNGYIEAPTHGAYRIQSIITHEPVPLAKLPLVI
ncbi:MAG TPA: hypothetical protein VFQ60_03450 [Patescibacteria group bacterium]|nr:hypothetical protein [Patescibacteria group bacterium]